MTRRSRSAPKSLERRSLYLAAPFVLAFLLFYVLPYARTIWYSLVESAFSPRFAGVANYAAVLGNRYFRMAVFNTIRFLALGVPMLLALSLVLALSLFALGTRFRWLHAAFFLPILLPSSAIVPVARAILRAVPPVDAAARTATYFLYLWKNTGFLLIIQLAALYGLPTEVQEAAALDGASPRQTRRYILIPMIRPVLGVCAVLAAAQSLRLFREVYLLFGEYPPFSAYLLQHYINNHFFKLNYQMLSAAALILMAALLLACGLAVLGMRRVKRA